MSGRVRLLRQPRSHGHKDHPAPFVGQLCFWKVQHNQIEAIQHSMAPSFLYVTKVFQQLHQALLQRPLFVGIVQHEVNVDLSTLLSKALLLCGDQHFSHRIDALIHSRSQHAISQQHAPKQLQCGWLQSGLIKCRPNLCDQSVEEIAAHQGVCRCRSFPLLPPAWGSRALLLLHWNRCTKCRECNGLRTERLEPLHRLRVAEQG
mmetsp:Transcript_137350/g.250387  ORF Transcript_137350/g.250387 Transcript_137350/m.250387 type:complete len:204 (+) Transcript_137350:117-728(+)